MSRKAGTSISSQKKAKTSRSKHRKTPFAAATVQQIVAWNSGEFRVTCHETKTQIIPSPNEIASRHRRKPVHRQQHLDPDRRGPVGAEEGEPASVVAVEHEEEERDQAEAHGRHGGPALAVLLEPGRREGDKTAQEGCQDQKREHYGRPHARINRAAMPIASAST